MELVKCLYVMCGHNSSFNSCNFIKIPDDECMFKIWKKYADFSNSDVKNVSEPTLCSCHFGDSFNYPIPHYLNTKRTSTKQDLNPDENDEPKAKLLKYECKDTHSKAEESISQSELLLDSSADYLEDVENQYNDFNEHNENPVEIISVESPDNSEEILGK